MFHCMMLSWMRTIVLVSWEWNDFHFVKVFFFFPLNSFTDVGFWRQAKCFIKSLFESLRDAYDDDDGGDD